MKMMEDDYFKTTQRRDYFSIISLQAKWTTKPFSSFSLLANSFLLLLYISRCENKRKRQTEALKKTESN